MTSLYLLVLIVKRAMCFAKTALRSLISEQILLFVLLFHSFPLILNKVRCTQEYKTNFIICFAIPFFCSTFAI